MIPIDLFTKNINIRNHNLKIDEESRKLWRSLVINKFTAEEADTKRSLYLAKFLDPEITYTVIDDVKCFEELPENGDFTVKYTLSKLIGSDKVFVFDSDKGKWSSEAYKLY